MLPRGLFLAITCLICAVWTANVIVGFVDPTKHDPAINAIFAIVVGAVYALGRKEPGDTTRSLRQRIGAAISGDPPEAPPTPDDNEGGGA